MFDIGDYVVYGQNGICQVLDITHPEITGVDSKRLYYVLAPEKSRDSKLFCPADNEKILLRKVISADEARKLIDESRELEPMWIMNDRLRDDSYKKAMKSCDLRQCIQIIKALLIRKKQREESGKKITATDERYLKQAEENLYSELSIATGLDRDKINDLLIENLQVFTIEL